MDNTDLGPLWNEVAGEWEIIDAHLVPVSGAAVVITTKRNQKSKRGVLEGNFNLTGEGPWEIDFLLNAKADGSFSQAVTFEATATECTLYAGGVQKSFDDDDVDGKKPTSWVFPGATEGLYFFRACLNDGLLHLWISGAESGVTSGFSACVWDISIDPDPTGQGYAGIKRVAGEMKFDWIRYAHHDHDGFDDPFCPDCSCVCETETSKAYAPFRMYFEIEDESNGCPGVDGTYMIFEPISCGDEASQFEQFICVASTLPGEPRNWQVAGALGAAKLDCGYDALLEGWFVVRGINIGAVDLLAAKTVNCNPIYCEYEWESSPEGDELCDPNVQLLGYLTEYSPPP